MRFNFVVSDRGEAQILLCLVTHEYPTNFVWISMWLILWWILLIYMFLLDQERTRLIEDSKEGRVALKATTNADWLKSMRRKIRPLLSDPYPVQYLGYCTMCNFFNPSYSIDLMIKNWTAKSHTSAIRVTLIFSTLSIFPLSLLHAYPYSKISETLSSSRTCLRISLSLSLMPKKKATSDAPVTSPPKNECEPTVFQLPTQMWLDLVIKFMKKKNSCQRSSICFIYSTKNYLFLSLLFFF